MIELPEVVQTPRGPRVPGPDATLLLELIGEYESQLIARGVRPSDYLSPGLPRETVIDRLADAGLDAPEELVVLYQWHDGVHPTHINLEPLPRFPFASLDRAISRYSRMQELKQQYGWPQIANGTGPGWLPLVDSNVGLSIECADSAREGPRIHYVDVEMDDGSGEVFAAVSLCTMFTWWVVGLRNGAYEWGGPTNGWILDDSKLPEGQLRFRFV